MRRIVFMLAAVAVLATLPAAAQTGTKVQGVTGGQMKSGTAVKLRTNKPLADPVGSTATAGISALTAQECADLGGTVYEDATLCRSGKYCGRADEAGNRHRVCLEAASE
jgi:hypothetical protein